MYQVVTDVLYQSPIVQNFGLFLKGIEKPLVPIKHRPKDGESEIITTKTKTGPLIEHKRNLLGKVRKLTLIHYSSFEPLKDVHMMSTARRNQDVDLDSCSADDLGQADLDGWKLARDLIHQVDHPGMSGSIPFAYRNAFSRLESLSFGTWDDGRWRIYEREVAKDYQEELRYHEGGFGYSGSFYGSFGDDSPARYRQEVIWSARKVCPSSQINSILKKVFHDTHPIDICQNNQATINLKFGFDSSLKVIHNGTIEVPTFHGRVRIYTTTKGLGVRLSRDIRIGNLRLNYNRQMKPVFKLAKYNSYLDDDSESESGSVVDDLSAMMQDPLADSQQSSSASALEVQDLVASMIQAYQAKSLAQKPSRAKHSLELCIAPETPGDEGQLQLALDIQDALRTYGEASQAKDGEASHAKDGTNESIWTFKITVGEAIPACPCCGKRS
jgi:hypothetical protein